MMTSQPDPPEDSSNADPPVTPEMDNAPEAKTPEPAPADTSKVTVPLLTEGPVVEVVADPAPQAQSVELASGLKPISSEETQLLYELVGDGHILTVVVLIGASALLPVPFLDDVAKAYLERRLLRTIAEGESLKLSPEEVDRLTQEPPKSCCMWGCMGKIFFYPIKKMIRKILFFLEIKRAVDQCSTALAEAWLFSLALRRGLWSPGRSIAEADLLRQVMEASCQSQGVKPLETVFHHAFRGAKGTLLDFAGRFTGKSIEDKAQMDAAVQKLEAEEKDSLARLSKKLKEGLGEVGEVYLQTFAKEFEGKMEVARSQPLPPIA